MCFNIRNNIESATLWVAKQDMVCYKLLNKGLVSPYQGFQYEYDKLYKAKIGKLNKRYNFINSKNGIILDKELNFNTSIFTINKGLHSYSNLEKARQVAVWRWGGLVVLIYKSIIPRGSEFYYDNAEKEYISNQLIIKKLIK